MRQKIAAGNWKMNLEYSEAISLAHAVIQSDIPTDVQVVLAVPFVYLAELAEMASVSENIIIAAQNCHFEESGAFTGEVSASMLQSIGVDTVVIGHSERRMYFSESDEILKRKVDHLLSKDMDIIFCCGEERSLRESGDQNEFVAGQLRNSLFHLDEEAFQNIVIAYEPIWAIGTGLTATPEQAQEMHAFIRAELASKYGKETANSTSILYGGSVNAKNAMDLFDKKDVDGGLVGGASLKADSFTKVIHSF